MKHRRLFMLRALCDLSEYHGLKLKRQSVPVLFCFQRVYPDLFAELIKDTPIL